MAASPGELLDTRFLQQLEKVRLAPGRSLTARELGDQASRRFGASVEFSDYRAYQPGDDYRTIDWTLLARLDRLFVRLFRAEENLRLEIFIDGSPSMHFARPTKVEFAARLAAAVGFIALRHGDRVSAAVFGQSPSKRYADTRGRTTTAELFRYLTGELTAAGTDLNRSLRRLAATGANNAVTLVLSDLLDPSGYESGLDALLQSGRRVCLIHLLSPEELRPDTAGDFAWIDAETSATVEISVDAHTLQLYREVLARWVEEIRHFCHSRRVDYYQVDTGTKVEDLVLKELRRGGLLR